MQVAELADTERGVTVDAVRAALTHETTAVAVSLVDYRTGYLADLAGIRDVIGDRLLIVDAIQGFGVVDADWSAADVVCGNGYKWLRAGRGAGFAKFSATARERIEPRLSGYGGMDGEIGGSDVPAPLPDAGAYRVAASDPVSAARLAVAAREVADAGVAGIAARVRENAQRVMALADEYGIPVLTDRERHAGIIALAPEADALASLGAALANNGLVVTARGGLIRVAVHAGTSESTLARLADAFAEAATPPTHMGVPDLPPPPALDGIVVLAPEEIAAGTPDGDD